MISTLVRWIFTLALIGGIYSETGCWTAIAFFLMVIQAEVHAELYKKMRQ